MSPVVPPARFNGLEFRRLKPIESEDVKTPYQDILAICPRPEGALLCALWEGRLKPPNGKVRLSDILLYAVAVYDGLFCGKHGKQ
jgi:hypothetical protein